MTAPDPADAPADDRDLESILAIDGVAKVFPHDDATAHVLNALRIPRAGPDGRRASGGADPRVALRIATGQGVPAPDVARAVADALLHDGRPTPAAIHVQVAHIHRA